ncbi:unnamed protein product [Rotaria sp. Silwood1]|nr:unnamed protein product [Rotaria sp. Silwood1]CAF4742338.1 unnamed protein product [Rotaria sp. Silwood1]
MDSLRSINEEENTNRNRILVGIRLMFIRIGEIDTLNEKYQAQASIEARWVVPSVNFFSTLSPLDQDAFNRGKSVSLIKYTETNWHPQLFIENALGDLKEQIRYTARKTSNDQACICEHRDIKGLFWEKLELNHFPSDIQELSVSVGSMFYNDRVLLMPDPYYRSGVNHEAFVDQQEWKLYQHVNVQQRFVREFFESIGDDEYDDINSNEGRKRSLVSVSCHVG